MTNAILNILQSGDEIVAGCGLYGGTVELFDELKSFGITTRYVKENVPHEYETLINDRTRLVFAETIGNPKLDVKVNTYRKFVTSENIMDLIGDYDFILDETDNFPDTEPSPMSFLLFSV